MPEIQLTVDFDRLRAQVAELQAEHARATKRAAELLEALEKLQNWLCYIERLHDYAKLHGTLEALQAGELQQPSFAIAWPTQLKWPGENETF